jgi:hypothetical protein
MPKHHTYGGYKRERQKRERWAAKYERDKVAEARRGEVRPGAFLAGIAMIILAFALFSTSHWLAISLFVVGGLVGNIRRKPT